MMSFSLDYLLRQVVVSGKENAVDVTPRAESPSRRRLRSVFEAGIRLHRVFREPPNASDPSMRRNRAGSRANICSWSPGAKPFLGSSLRKKL